MKHMQPLNRKAQRIDEYVAARAEDVVALQNPSNRQAPAAPARPHGLLADVLARLGSGFGRRHGRPLPARRARYLRLLGYVLLAGAGARPYE